MTTPQPTPGVYGPDQGGSGQGVRWQPISTYVDDGDSCLVCDVWRGKPHTIALAYRRQGAWFYDCSVEQIDFEPLYWMAGRGGRGNPFHEPLPAPPEVSA